MIRLVSWNPAVFVATLGVLLAGVPWEQGLNTSLNGNQRPRRSSSSSAARSALIRSFCAMSHACTVMACPRAWASRVAYSRWAPGPGVVS